MTITAPRTSAAAPTSATAAPISTAVHRPAAPPDAVTADRPTGKAGTTGSMRAMRAMGAEWVAC
ncbi:hypothetical protein ABZX90_33540 [Streptomyces sp. NPDC002935]|uniref:hypothetical protein n=1 Tax=Streptomyces sp. NPDC002935 TaxID=3154545 RepID=UPI0033ACC407